MQMIWQDNVRFTLERMPVTDSFCYEIKQCDQFRIAKQRAPALDHNGEEDG